MLRETYPIRIRSDHPIRISKTDSHERTYVRTDGEVTYASTSWNVLQRVRAYGESVAAGLSERLADAAAKARSR